MTDTATMVALGADYPELRESVRKICERYPGGYWRKLEAEQAYPTEFITELTQGGFLASLIPEEYGGSGFPFRAAAVMSVVETSATPPGAAPAAAYLSRKPMSSLPTSSGRTRRSTSHAPSE